MKPPSHLSASARREWSRLTREIQFQASDFSTLLAYVEAFSRYKLASTAVDKEGLTIEYPVFNRSGVQVSSKRVRNPNLLTLKDERAAMLRAAYLLGLTDVADDEDTYAS